MKKTALTAFGVALLLVWAAATSKALRAGPQPRAQDQDEAREAVRPEMANFDVFLDGHPELARQLHNNPELINDKDFVQDHAQLRDYLNDHPNVREDLREHPRAFMNGEHRFDEQEARRDGDRDTKRGELTSFDGFLDNHPGINRELSKDPSLVSNRDYLDKHPELKDFLSDHPQVRQELNENPRAFMRSEHRTDNRMDNRPDKGRTPPPVEAAPDRH